MLKIRNTVRKSRLRRLVRGLNNVRSAAVRAVRRLLVERCGGGEVWGRSSGEVWGRSGGEVWGGVVVEKCWGEEVW